MINKKTAKRFCKEDISLIENYDKAIADTTQTWDCHHRDEVKILPCGIKVIRTREELIENGRYYKCPANELIFLTRKEHAMIHHSGNKYAVGLKPMLGKHQSELCKRRISEAMKGKHLSELCKRRISEAMKGRATKRNIVHSEFGNKFKEHYEFTCNDNPKLYHKEYNWYANHNNKCRWEE